MDRKESYTWKGKRHPWERARFEVVRNLIESGHGAPIVPFSVVADIGCGDAYVTIRLSERYKDTRFIGIDRALPREEAGARAAPNCPLFGTLRDAAKNLPGDITHLLLLDVLEHTMDESAFIQDITTGLPIAPHASCLVTVPAFQPLYSAHDRYLGHYRRYSRRSLRATLERSGFRILHDGYFFLSLVAPRLFRAAYERFRSPGNPESELLRSAPGSVIAGEILTWALVLDYYFGALLRGIGIQLPGLSVFAVCRRHV